MATVNLWHWRKPQKLFLRNHPKIVTGCRRASGNFEFGIGPHSQNYFVTVSNSMILPIF
jgi:hypothetical protein